MTSVLEQLKRNYIPGNPGIHQMTQLKFSKLTRTGWN